MTGLFEPACAWEKDKVCPVNCKPSNDGDCCEINKAVYGGLYESEDACRTCSFEKDQLCPAACTMDNDNDCCVYNDGKWLGNKCFKEFPEHFSWKDRYYSLISPVKNQGDQSTCDFMAQAALMEAYIQMYYNKNLNLDLSEQALMCPQLQKTGTKIAVDEACLPFEGDDDKGEKCTNLCKDWEKRVWKVTNVSRDKKSFTEFKNDLIKNGPLWIAQLTPGVQHAMLAIGYSDDPNADCLTIEVKNSWGTSWADFGFGKVCINKKKFSKFIIYYYLAGEVIPPAGVSLQIACLDNDKDGYCNWGISPNKPSSCPASCKPEKDWDDKDPNINVKPNGILW